MRNEFTVFTILSLLIVGLVWYFFWPPILWSLVILGPVILLGIYDMSQRENAIIRNFPVLGRGRYLMEELRPKIYQYFIESNTNGRPISRIYREIVDERAQKAMDTNPFGTQLDVYEEGYEWMNHSIAAKDPHSLAPKPKIKVGGPHCKKPFHASILNVSAMSYGSLSSVAVEALNAGAAMGGFAHNTGEGGISPYHNRPNGDLIYQVGTGYFGCRTKDGNFSPDEFQKLVKADNVKMIELKLSQGAKPGHGGILPAKKNTKEIAEIRGVEPGTAVISPPYHKAFSTPKGLLQLIRQMQDLSGGKPVGFKLCIGHKSEFFAICKAMVETGITPDFIAVDGGEGGTGAAPLEFSNSVGMPYKEGLAFAYDALIGFDLKKDIKLFASGKILTGFHLYRALALGADAAYSARAMMIALGCIHALECNQNTCPTGVTTQNKELMKGLDIGNKSHRVANYHHETVEAFVELMAAAGLDSVDQINRSQIYRRISMTEFKRYDEVFPYIANGCLLDVNTVPERYKAAWVMASSESFSPTLHTYV